MSLAAAAKLCAEYGGLVVGSAAQGRSMVGDYDFVLPLEARDAVCAFGRSLPDVSAGYAAMLDNGVAAHAVRSKLRVCEALFRVRSLATDTEPAVDIMLYPQAVLDKARDVGHVVRCRFGGVQLEALRVGPDELLEIAKVEPNPLRRQAIVAQCERAPEVMPQFLPITQMTELRWWHSPLVRWLLPKAVKNAKCGNCGTASVYRWLWIEWIGWPYPLRLRLRRAWCPVYFVDRKGCGCIRWLREWWYSRYPPKPPEPKPQRTPRVCPVHGPIDH